MGPCLAAALRQRRRRAGFVAYVGAHAKPGAARLSRGSVHIGLLAAGDAELGAGCGKFLGNAEIDAGGAA